MVNVYDEAHALARALKESPEYKHYVEVKTKVSANPELSEMINDFRDKQMQLQAQQMLGQEAAPEMLEQVQSLYEIVLKDPLAAQFMQAEYAFTRVVGDVYGILGEVVKLD
ncbi:MAG TPA: YlbF family regulator [Clostridiales bacterium]|jgi:cell fate (sporulation/competence/biofilm development) regulator YlbF (YheA/YmcA/DUF963 family)|nr:YlbF family regulator [Clostridiales bacterium]